MLGTPNQMQDAFQQEEYEAEQANQRELETAEIIKVRTKEILSEIYKKQGLPTKERHSLYEVVIEEPEMLATALIKLLFASDLTQSVYINILREELLKAATKYAARQARSEQ